MVAVCLYFDYDTKKPYKFQWESQKLGGPVSVFIPPAKISLGTPVDTQRRLD